MTQPSQSFTLAGYLDGPFQLSEALTFIPAKRQVPVAFGDLEGPFTQKPTVATIFLGLTTGQDVRPRRTFTVDDVTEALRQRLAKVKLEASIVAQTGIIKERGRWKPEPSVQIVIIETEGKPWKVFQEKTLGVARWLRTTFRQDRVFVAYVKEGDIQPTWALP